MIKPVRHVVTLEATRFETHDTKTFTFSSEYVFEPGQFVNVRFEQDDALGKRSFSIASGPHEKLEITVKRIGVFTNELFTAPIGTRFEIHGPLGLPYIRSSPEDPYLLIAGGSGIAPFRSLMRDHRLAETRFTLIDSNRTYDDIIYRDEIERWHAKVIHTLTRENHHGIRHGRIDRGLLDRIPHIRDHRVLICGPPGLVSASIEHLLSLGIPVNRIKSESWGN